MTDIQEPCPLCKGEYDIDDESSEHMNLDMEELRRIFGTPSS